MRTLIVGSGFVGRALAARLIDDGGEAVLAARRPPAAPGAVPIPWMPLDVTDAEACRRAPDRAGADAMVLVHGPSDVTWCTANPRAALDGHAGAAERLADAADGRRLVLISTDNVFDGEIELPSEATPPAPANAYGRAKLAAERALAGRPGATVLRVSLVYGWEPEDGGKWLNFFAACAHRLRRGEPVTAPYDQWTTPVLVDDVAAVTAAVLGAADLPLLHLGGPDRLSRADWARAIAARLGVPDELVTGVARAGGRYADRPRNSCLTSVLRHRHPATAGIAVRGVAAGARDLLAPARAGV
ncbi:SDR family oxidoreductase [Dactylosporangium sp. CA-139114]|uniref:SDR family oxidoreductase n=1 Tax=Dactylosporangium sp. CA-139114 TaxID=3239931 RepID=UPI003D95100E